MGRFVEFLGDKGKNLLGEAICELELDEKEESARLLKHAEASGLLGEKASDLLDMACRGEFLIAKFGDGLDETI
jgi:hypothetical protein